jgi:adenylate kinase family enzyme
MSETTQLKPNTLFVEVAGAGLPEVDGLYVPSQAAPTVSESGTVSSPGYWNGKMAWDRADGRSARSPAISYSNSYRSWRICRLDGHLAYEITGDHELPPAGSAWNVYKMGVPPAPTVTIHHVDPRQPCPAPNVMFVLGGPGAGKGTMCELAEIQLGWTHLSAGGLLRAEQAAGGPSSDVIKECIAAGALVPTEITVRLLKEAMERTIRTTGKRNFLVDGFPRSLTNLEAWRQAHDPVAELPTLLYFECPFEVLEQRVLRRAKFSGRADDNLEAVKLRFDTFKAETLPTVQLFRNSGKCVDIDTSQDRQSVYALLRDQLARYTDSHLMPRPLEEKAEMLLGLRPYPAV